MSFILSAVLLAGSGCGKKEEAVAEEPTTAVSVQEATPVPTQEVVVTETPTPEPEEEPEKTELPEGQMYSYLTGEPVDAEIGQTRPVAIMINNLQPAIPQSGLPQAEILYEIMVEGKITRLMAIFQDLGGLEKIGPVRSLRHYYMDFANDNQADLVYFGGSYLADNRVASEGRPVMNGMTDSGFFRSSDRYAPHNAYTSANGVTSTYAAKGVDRTYAEGYEPNLLFKESDEDLPSGETAETVHIPFSFDDPYFIYNAQDRLYYRYEYGKAHVDQETGTQLAFKNIIVQYVDQWMVPESTSDHQDMNLYTEGPGLYITDGKAVEITWKKTGHDDATRYYYTDGSQVELNPGKTMFEIVNNPNRVTFE